LKDGISASSVLNLTPAAAAAVAAPGEQVGPAAGPKVVWQDLKLLGLTIII